GPAGDLRRRELVRGGNDVQGGAAAVLRHAEHVVDVPPHQVPWRDEVSQEVLVPWHAVHVVPMADQEVVQPEPVDGRRLSETEHLHLEEGSSAPDEVFEGLEHGQVEPFRVYLDEAEPDRKSTRLNSSHGSIS